MKHTTGPWIAIPNQCGWTLHSNGVDITAEAFDCSEADILLIAAAPELLEAAKKALELLEDTETEHMYSLADGSTGKMLKEAIARAEGNKHGK